MHLAPSVSSFNLTSGPAWKKVEKSFWVELRTDLSQFLNRIFCSGGLTSQTVRGKKTLRRAKRERFRLDWLEADRRWLTKQMSTFFWSATKEFWFSVQLVPLGKRRKGLWHTTLSWKMTDLFELKRILQQSYLSLYRSRLSDRQEQQCNSFVHVTH